MTKQANTVNTVNTVGEMETQADRMRERIDAIGRELTTADTAEHAGQLAAERAGVQVVLDGVLARIDAAIAEQNAAERAAAERARADELAAVSRELDDALAGMRDLVHQLDQVGDSYRSAAQRYVGLGGSTWSRPGVSADLGRVVKQQLQLWKRFDAIPAERAEQEARARRERQERREREQRLQDAREKEAERLAAAYPGYAVDTSNWTPPPEQS